MENTQYQNQEEFIPEGGEDLSSEALAKEEVEGGNSGNGLEKADPESNHKTPQVLMNLGAFLKNEVDRLQSLATDLEAKKQKVERQVQVNKDTLEKLSLVEKQAQEIISESVKIQKENEAIFQQNVKEKVVNNDANESLTMQQIWR